MKMRQAAGAVKMTVSNNGIPIKNIYYMLCYAYDIYYEKDFLNDTVFSADPESFGNMQRLMAEILIRRVSYQLKKGLLRDYEERREELTAVRGKINLRETLGRGCRVRGRLFCEFDEYVSDTLMNRIVKSVMLSLLRGDITAGQKGRLKRLLGHFGEVDRTDLRGIEWGRMRFTGNNREYRFLMSICRVIAENMIFSTEEGRLEIREFGGEKLDKLYEKFLRNYFKFHWRDGFSAGADKVKWDCPDKDEYLPEMNTDISLHDRMGNRKLIIDAKFYKKNVGENTKHTDETGRGKETLISEHLYQIFAYVTNESVRFGGEVSGMMLYAGTENSGLDEKGHEYVIGGHRYVFRALDMNRDFNEIRKSLDGIAERFLNGGYGK
ncbi:MAG: hypothetical protein NC078_04520 [Ruminococcus sp.]|nr:hypothetical protein [Ruminococcus sp.]